MSHTPVVYNIQAGLSFADSLAAGILQRASEDPLALSEYLILLPSRRACRTLRDAFLRLSGGKAILLPRMQPVGDVDADEVSLMLAAEEDAEDVLNIPPAVSRLQRQILLAKLILKSGTAQSFDQAAALALDLGAFLDEVQTENLSFEALKNLVPEKFSAHWQMTLEFLTILTDNWPLILAERGVIDYADRRNRLIRAQIRAWQKHPPQFPVIAAGSTGNVPAARELLALVTSLPQGELVLPGFDTGMDDESWNAMGEDHPQFSMKELLETAAIDRAVIRPWPLDHAPPVNHARVRLLSETMRPARTTEQWRQLTPDDIPAQAMDGFCRIDCDTPQEEADVIALILREALETEGKTAALITPDRRLARRVALSMRRWGIQIDDSGGQPLTETYIGTWLMLSAEMAEEQLAPVTLLSLLKHPIMAARLEPQVLREMVSLLDRIVLRGPRPSAGFAGLRDAIEVLDADKMADARRKLLSWIDTAERVMQDFTARMASATDQPFRDILQAHLTMAEALATTLDEDGGQRLWALEQGEAASKLLGDLFVAAHEIPPMQPRHYVSLLGTLLKSITVRPSFGSHPRLFILGQIEARLYAADLVVLGGLNEGTWPALPAHDPWMSRPMRRDFGLPSPEKAISLTAHDFVQAASAPDVIITRAAKVDGTPTVPARWLMRMETVLQAVGVQMPDARARQYRQWLRDMDTPADVPKPVSRPQPRPPVAARPTELSVTRIETWMRDPYQIYADKILRLRALDPIDADPGGAERGTFIHAALDRFIKAYPKVLPPDAEDVLLVIGREAMDAMRVPEEVAAFWWPRFEKIAHHFTRQENEWRQYASPCATEISGALDMGGFTLTGKADRIDTFADGSYAVIDYKSGYAPKKSEVAEGLAPQLPLEAFMLEHGAFDGLPPAPAAQMVYWKVTGSGQKPVERIEICGEKDKPADELAAEAAAGLRQLIDAFRDENTPYLSQPRADAKPKFSDYEHLARVKEWGVAADEAEDAA
jgi:ATP-dependent helicase/nuclease subunit B